MNNDITANGSRQVQSSPQSASKAGRKYSFLDSLHGTYRPKALGDCSLDANKMVAMLRCESDLIDRHQDSEIAKFYANRSVFITGASGFVGKVSTFDKNCIKLSS